MATYSPHIFSWCQRFGLQDSDAADVTQAVLLKLVRLMQDFEYQPDKGSFRGWLKTVTSNLTRDLLRQKGRISEGAGDTDAWSRIANLGDPSAYEALANLIEESYERELLAIASERIQKRVQPKTWQAYEAVRDGLTSAQAAAQLGINVADVYVAKSRIVKLLKSEVEKLDRDE